MAAKFELYKSSNGEYRWRLRASNGRSLRRVAKAIPPRLPRRVVLNR
jgi:hypothetical protein